MKLVITIDTEEDNWGVFSTSGHTVENIGKIPALQEIFDAYDVKPTYLVTYPVATDPGSIAIFREIEKSGRCEIGMHCHPWNTPPFDEDLNENNSMLCNLPYDLQYKKMSILNDAIIRNFDLRPVSFRSGRWGFDGHVAMNLCRLGYKIDTSITPFVDWTNYCGPDFSQIQPWPFMISYGKEFGEGLDGGLLEIPASIGYVHGNWTLCNMIFNRLNRKPLSRLKFIGLADRLHLNNRISLTPELSGGKQMIKLASRFMRDGHRIINLFFHSTTLKAGLTSFDEVSKDEKLFLERIKVFLSFTRDSGIESIKLSDALKLQNFLQKKSADKDNNPLRYNAERSTL